MVSVEVFKFSKSTGSFKIKEFSSVHADDDSDWLVIKKIDLDEKNFNDKVAPSDQFVNNEKIEKFLTPKNFRKFLKKAKVEKYYSTKQF